MGRQPQWAARLSDADWQHLTALRLFHAVQPEPVLLEVVLPRVDGFGILRQVRQAGENPVIMLAACMDDIDRLVDLQMGTDASVIHPFNSPKVVERVKAVLRRARPVDPGKPISVAGIEIDPCGMRFSAGGARLDLLLSEDRLLKVLAQHEARSSAAPSCWSGVCPNPERWSGWLTLTSTA